MKFVNFKFNQKATLGVFNSSGKVVNLADLDINVRDMNELIINFDEFKHKFKDLDSKTAYEIPKEDYLAPIIEPRQDIICLGINFLDHAKESAQFKGEKFEEREYPVYFGKRCNQATAPFGSISLHADVTSQLDYECELAFILSKDAYKIKAEDAKDYIFGIPSSMKFQHEISKNATSNFTAQKALREVLSWGLISQVLMRLLIHLNSI